MIDMDLYFWVFASMSVLAGLFTIAARDALPSAMGLLTVFIALAGLYLHLHAPLIAIFQVAIYAGAILILVVFVIMLLMAPGERLAAIQANVSYRGAGALLGLCLIGLIAVGTKGVSEIVSMKALPEGFGNPSMFGDLLFRDFLLHFEVVSVLLLVALIGGIYLCKKKL
ncbi:MAG: NADH-quinone oxidoreductase subunit J [Thermodesulfobacteriota bacterium]|nr:MAG: NADH-quinone oxidoreductase subunit J [Thermodesulfobacteriota bacterium]